MACELFVYYRLAADSDGDALRQVVNELQTALSDIARCRLYRRRDARGETWMEHYNALSEVTIFTARYQSLQSARTEHWQRHCPTGRHEEWFEHLA